MLICPLHLKGLPAFITVCEPGNNASPIKTSQATGDSDSAYAIQHTSIAAPKSHEALSKSQIPQAKPVPETTNINSKVLSNTAKSTMDGLEDKESSVSASNTVNPAPSAIPTPISIRQETAGAQRTKVKISIT